MRVRLHRSALCLRCATIDTRPNLQTHLLRCAPRRGRKLLERKRRRPPKRLAQRRRKLSKPQVRKRPTAPRQLITNRKEQRVRTKQKRPSSNRQARTAIRLHQVQAVADTRKQVVLTRGR